jgi:hypothetical protein
MTDVRPPRVSQQPTIEMNIPTPTLLKALWVANLSKGSLSCETPKEHKAGTAVIVALVVPGHVIQLYGVVRNSVLNKITRGYLLSVEVDIGMAHREIIEDVIGQVKDFRGKFY